MFRRPGFACLTLAALTWLVSLPEAVASEDVVRQIRGLYAQAQQDVKKTGATSAGELGQAQLVNQRSTPEGNKISETLRCFHRSQEDERTSITVSSPYFITSKSVVEGRNLYQKAP